MVSIPRTHRLSGTWAKVAWVAMVAGRVLVPGGAAMAGKTGVFSVKDYGAAGDGKALDTQAILKAIAACTAAGGGQVVFPAGTSPISAWPTCA